MLQVIFIEPQRFEQVECAEIARQRDQTVQTEVELLKIGKAQQIIVQDTKLIAPEIQNRNRSGIDPIQILGNGTKPPKRKI